MTARADVTLFIPASCGRERPTFLEPCLRAIKILIFNLAHIKVHALDWSAYQLNNNVGNEADIRISCTLPVVLPPTKTPNLVIDVDGLAL